MKYKLLFVAIVFFAFGLRVYGINWDQNQHLHPDERFLTMVGMAMNMPESFGQYLDPARSSLNPYHTNFTFFVYGTLPLTLTKVVTNILQLESYNLFTLVGRFLSALFDIGTLIFIYLLAKLWVRRYNLDEKLPILSAFFYSIAVLPIQQAHFFVNDSFLTFFVLGSFYFATRLTNKSTFADYIFIFLSAGFFGLGLATKINIIYILPLITAMIFFRQGKQQQNLRWPQKIIMMGLFIIIAYFSIRLGDPKFFSTGNIFDFSINPQFIANLQQLLSLNNSESLYPPGVQWIGKSPLFPLVNVVFFGLGLPYFLFSLFGLYVFVQTKKREFVFIALWILVFFTYQSFQYVKTMRYFLILYPFFAILTAFGYINLAKIVSKRNLWVFHFLAFAAILIWPLSFLSIYTRPHSRVAASSWIHQNIAEGSFLAGEHWDDLLPLPVLGVESRSFTSEPLPVFDQDTPEKWQKIREILSRSDYYIISSNRAYAHIINLVDRYPRQSQFYKDLFAGKTEFVKIKEFTSYPTFPLCFMLLCFMINDQWADEAFTVYDHPKVMIFKKN